MSRHLSTVILCITFLSTGFAAPSHEDTHDQRAVNLRHIQSKWSTVNGVEQGSLMNTIPSNDWSDRFLQQQMDQLYDEIVQEMVEAEAHHEEYKVFENAYNGDNYLKNILFNKMNQMYEQTVAQNNGKVYAESWHDQDNTKMGTLIDRFLHDKIRNAMLQHKEPADFYDYAASVSNDEYTAQIMNNENSYIPIYRFDGEAKEYCYPDWPSAANDNKCLKSLNSSAPVFYQVSTCAGETVYTYWLWYGKQQPCFLNQGEHGNDWEHVSVYVNPSDGLASKVVYHQHGGHYTRRRGEYKREGERPIVYVGKIAHGSYHTDCNGQCSWAELFCCACYGSVRFCIGGCGYWDDFRNPGPELRNPQLHLLNEGQVIDGIERPNREICNLATCEGSDSRSLTESGCWQDKPPKTH